MKKYLMLLLFSAFIFGGCYTVIWEPDDEFPTEESYQNTDDGYYEPYYVGPYVNYYYQPWWLTIAPPSVSTEKPNKRSSETEKIRNSDGGRGNDNGREPVVTRPVTREPIINTPPVSVPGNSGSSGTTTDKPKDNSNNSNSGSRSGSDNKSSSGRDSGRNDDGSRNSDGGRRK